MKYIGLVLTNMVGLREFWIIHAGPDLAGAEPNSKRICGAPKIPIFCRKDTKNPKITKMAITLALIVRFIKFKKFWKAQNLLFAGSP